MLFININDVVESLTCICSKPYAYLDSPRTVGPSAYDLPSFKRLSRLQKYFTDQRYSNLKYI